jgi:hypothetical protein
MHSDGELATAMIGIIPDSKSSVGESGARLASGVIRQSLEGKGSQGEAKAGIAFAVRQESEGTQVKVGQVLGITGEISEVRLSRKGSRAIRVKAGKVKELVKKFDGAAIQEEGVMDTTTQSAHMSTNWTEIEGKMIETKVKDGMATKINRIFSPTDSIAKVENNPCKDEERKKGYEGKSILQVYRTWDMKAASEPKNDDAMAFQPLTGSEFDEIFGFKDIAKRTNKTLDHTSVALQPDSNLDQDTFAGRCFDLSNLVTRFLAHNPAVPETILSLPHINFITELDKLPTQDESFVHESHISILAADDPSRSESSLKLPSNNHSTTPAQVKRITENNETPTDADFTYHGDRFSTLIRQYSDLVTPASGIDEFLSQDDEYSSELCPLTIVPQHFDLLSPITKLERSTYAVNNHPSSSSRTATSCRQTSEPITPPRQHLPQLDSPSTTSLLQCTRTDRVTAGHKAHFSNASSIYSNDEAVPSGCPGEFPSSSTYEDTYSLAPLPARYHRSHPSWASSLYSHHSQDDNDSILPFNFDDHTHKTHLRLFQSQSSSSDPFFNSTSSSTNNSTGSNTPAYTPQAYFTTSQTSLGTDCSIDAYQKWEWEDEEVEGEDAKFQGRQSLIRDSIPIDGTVWNWDGSRWIGERPDGSLLF